MAKNLRIAAAGLIAYIVLFIPLLLLQVANMVSEGALDTFAEDVSFSLSRSLVVLYFIITVATITATILWIRGFVLLGRHLNNRLLVGSSYFLLTVVTIYNVLDWIPLGSPVDMIAGGIAFFFNGIALICFGIGILPLLNRLGGIATAYGVILITQGACILLILLAPLAVLLEIPVSVVGVIVLFKAARLFPFAHEDPQEY